MKYLLLVCISSLFLILYGIEMYANTCVTCLDKLIKLNNKILRILQNCPIRTHVHELYKLTKFNVLPLDKLYKLNHQIILLVFKCLNYAHLLPPLYANYFVLNAEVHDYNTRASTDLHVLGPRST